MNIDLLPTPTKTTRLYKFGLRYMSSTGTYIIMWRKDRRAKLGINFQIYNPTNASRERFNWITRRMLGEVNLLKSGLQIDFAVK